MMTLQWYCHLKDMKINTDILATLFITENDKELVKIKHDVMRALF